MNIMRYINVIAGILLSLQVLGQGNKFLHSSNNDENLRHEKKLIVSRLSVIPAQHSINVLVDGKQAFEFPLAVGVDSPEAVDNDLYTPNFRYSNGIYSWSLQSTLWQKKEYAIGIEGDAIVFRVKVSGKGKLGKVRYFTETPGKDIRLQYEVSRYFVPVALGGSNALPQWKNTMESASIDLGYFTPPILAFPFEGPFGGTLAVGLAPKRGHWNIDHFRCEFKKFDEGLFTTDFYGYTEVNGEYELPAITLTIGSDEFGSLASHCNWLYDYGDCKKIERNKIPRWWLGPIFCGWGEQAYQNPTGNELSFEDIEARANQKDYTSMMARMDSLSLKPTIIIIDAKWQSTYGEMTPDKSKWPDLRAFVDKEHAKGRKVLLWIKTWDNEGLPSIECVKNLTNTYCADPTSPLYQKRIRETMHKLLSSDPGSFNCDGLKIDFANCMPLGKYLATYESGVYGIELLKRMMSLIYASAKAAKPDCLINTSCCNPYFAEVTDQSRLHDYNGQLRFLWEVREFRAKLFQVSYPGISIDTDDEACTSRQQMINYLNKAPALGIPVLYHLHGTKTVPLTDDDFRNVAKIWDDYSKKLDHKK